VTMYGTKVEIKLKKAEASSWSKLEVQFLKKPEHEAPKKEKSPEIVLPPIEAVDLSDL